ncbi:MAG TPA: PP2C family protein-serine/threonine phosphatase [Bacteroidota bacterium]|nr:PP2C family protein-serine/threonine phosphatase [Bacteroidota bacterium]
MNQRQLYKTIENFDSKKFDSTEELLKHVLHQIVQNDSIEIQGGRVWKLSTSRYAYELIAQVGAVEKIKPHFLIKVNEYSVFKTLPKHRTVVAKETNAYLKSRGIFKYSATGVGDIVKVKGVDLYRYVMSFNTALTHDQVAPTLNIVGIAVTSMLRSRRIEKKSAQLEQDLDKARDIQRSILPEHELRFHNYEMFGVSIADKIVGGDFFDYIVSDENDRVSVVIGDAASKGISAAVQALYVSGALRMGASYQTKITALIRSINTLVHRTFSDDRFLTLFFAELIDDKQGLCVYVNAGHPSPILYRSKTAATESLGSTGNIIGPFPDQVFRSEGVMVSKGDILLLYTDGVTEAMDASGAQYSEKRLIEKLVEFKQQSAKDIARLILEDAQKFSSKGKYSDDKTVVVIKRVK